MKTLSKKEEEVLLFLFKDYSNNYNANSLSKIIKITPRGALKILKNLKSQNLLVSKQFGKATFYKINFKEEYALKLLSAFLFKESKEKASRWISDIKEVFPDIEIIIIFGSIIKDYEKANDVDMVLVFKKQNYTKIMNYINQKNKILLKPIHSIIQTPSDIEKNLKKKDPVIINALSQGYVLHGFDKLIEVVKDVTSF